MKKNVVIRITNIQSEGPQMVENHEVTTKGTFTETKTTTHKLH